MSDIPKTYDPSGEEELYRFWESRRYFSPAEPKLGDNIFSMVLPPPNVTGVLHMGHAEMLAIQDILARYHRMKGDITLWIPGTDHAAIATQEKVEREIYKKEKKNRHDLGREEFLKRVNEFASESHDYIVKQIKRMGASLDWSREAFTFDDDRSKAVREAFVKMYDAGLIYRGDRIVNWDPKMQTTVSDDEVEWQDEVTPFYYLKYGPFVIGTARPETKFGDKYVVMHPGDKRYKKYKDGEKIELEWINGSIIATIVKDEAIDPDFGTGVMTITPWHDTTDFEIAERHNLEKEQIIDLRGKLLPIAGEEFEGKKITEARELIVEKLKSKGLIEKIDEKYAHRVAVSSRGGGKIEPQILKQWFVSVNSKFQIPNSKIEGVPLGSETTLKEIMIAAVKNGQIKLVPERFEKIYFHWIENLRDWCISRQIWYGHRIPVFYCEKNKDKDMIIASSKPDKCSFCGKCEMEQDPDTLDTWFSSGLWTFSTLGWGYDDKLWEKEKAFHPMSILETGYDIIFFWVARMILMSGFLLGDIPFKTVYLHGLVRDDKGRKMSKSLGNIIDPLLMADKYGADATRLSLIIGAAPGNDIKLSEDRVRGYRNFSTKLWNIARFISMSGEGNFSGDGSLSDSDKKLLDEFEDLKKRVAQNIESFQFHLAAEELYHYAWHAFADKIIEEMKPRISGGDKSERDSAILVLKKIFYGILVLLHPFMPFVTDTIYRTFGELFVFAGERHDSLMDASW
ncbi:MAG: valine--tRNA ligase [Candidatus Harrisonbacteria bacterium CG10_big_fil_rev_8_21_14_0_10_40_38]|uniref:Valine--tRNA ligase n=1 Tax=Candidatus Harrisonbacteria bacterium CG10_big_fil_rev_8_21_14_0_10_40_38 TaxID=1974583 RepID=A0A2H0US79_9BACT|nr:MAG: valine--tRNA ligase [Candidatus Harrisonbacteria bacterium CG10_big_fil_rev_8_21_14_0_10_40_38]